MSQIHECPAACFACCSPVAMAYTRIDVELGRVHLSPRDRRWFLEELTPISRREGLRRAPYLGNGLTGYSVMGEAMVLPTAFYECSNLDRETGLCRSYDDLPDTCSGFPEYDSPWPDPKKNLPPTCVWRADLGLPVETPVPLPSRRTIPST